MTADDLIAYWSRMEDRAVHPDDDAFVDRQKFETRLHPVPWAGPLKAAKVCFLFLNPGLSEQDVAYETSNTDFSAILRANVRDGLQPYFYLLERFDAHPGYRWARRIFGRDIREAQTDSFCVVQLVAYHSAEGAPARGIADKLPSTGKARQFVRNTLVPNARAGHIGLIVARSAKLWLVDENSQDENLVVYRRGECRGAFQTKDTRGGQLFRRKLSRFPNAPSLQLAALSQSK